MAEQQAIDRGQYIGAVDQAQCLLHLVHAGAPILSIDHDAQRATVLEHRQQRAQTGVGIFQVMQYAAAVDVVELSEIEAGQRK